MDVSSIADNCAMNKTMLEFSGVRHVGWISHKHDKNLSDIVLVSKAMKLCRINDSAVMFSERTENSSGARVQLESGLD